MTWLIIARKRYWFPRLYTVPPGRYPNITQSGICIIDVSHIHTRYLQLIPICIIYIYMYMPCIYIHLHMYIHIYICIYVCMRVLSCITTLHMFVWPYTTSPGGLFKKRPPESRRVSGPGVVYLLLNETGFSKLPRAQSSSVVSLMQAIII